MLSYAMKNLLGVGGTVAFLMSGFSIAVIVVTLIFLYKNNIRTVHKDTAMYQFIEVSNWILAGSWALVIFGTISTAIMTNGTGILGRVDKALFGSNAKKSTPPPEIFDLSDL